MKKIARPQEARIPFTRQGYENLFAEKKDLLSQRPDAVEHLRLARGMGDLSENGYYKASRARLSFLDARIRRLDRLIRLAVVVENSGGDQVQIGSRVTVALNEAIYEYTIVGGYESDPARQTISHLSPMGRAILGKRVGDTVDVETPSGVRVYTIRHLVNTPVT